MDIFDGMIFQNKKGHSWKVVDCSKSRKVVVTSLEWMPYTTVVRKQGVIDRNVMYPYGRNLLGEYRGEGQWDASTKNPFYNHWKSMVFRCKDREWQEKHHSYLGVDVCDEWMCLQDFCNWADTQQYAKTKDIKWELDKDLLGDGKLYSPETCCFLPKDVNLFLSRLNDISIYEFVGDTVVSYRVWVRNGDVSKGHYIGAYPSYEQAYDIWKAKKNERLFALIDKYNFLPEHILDALKALKK